MLVEAGNIRCAIFDMDGTVIDSMEYWHNCKATLLQRYGVPTPPDWKAKAEHMELLELSVHVCTTYPELGKTPGEVVDDILTTMKVHYQQDIVLKRGAAEFLELLHARDITICLATASTQELAQSVLSRLGVRKYFSHLVTTEQKGIRNKHFPDIYLYAAGLAGVPPWHSMVFEDTQFSAQAAKEAGFRVVGLLEPHSHGTPEGMKKICEQVVDSYCELAPIL